MDVAPPEADLDEPEAGVIAPLPDELGVEGDGGERPGAVAEGFEAVGRVDHAQSVVCLRAQPKAWVRWTSMGSPATLWSIACAR